MSFDDAQTIIAIACDRRQEDAKRAGDMRSIDSWECGDDAKSINAKADETVLGLSEGLKSEYVNSRKVTTTSSERK